MNAKAWRLYAAGDARLEDVELEGAGEDGVVVEIVTNTICLSDYKALSLGTGHKRVPGPSGLGSSASDSMFAYSPLSTSPATNSRRWGMRGIRSAARRRACIFRR